MPSTQSLGHQVCPVITGPSSHMSALNLVTESSGHRCSLIGSTSHRNTLTGSPGHARVPSMSEQAFPTCQSGPTTTTHTSPSNYFSPFHLFPLCKIHNLLRLVWEELTFDDAVSYTKHGNRLQHSQMLQQWPEFVSLSPGLPIPRSDACVTLSRSWIPMDNKIWNFKVCI